MYQAYTWSQARNYCKTISAELLTIANQLELDAIVKLVSPLNYDLYLYVGYYYLSVNYLKFYLRKKSSLN